MNEQKMLSVKEAAFRLGVSPDTIYTLCQARKIAHVRIGLGRGKIKISEEALAEYLTGAAVATTRARPAVVRAAPAKVKLRHLRS